MASADRLIEVFHEAKALPTGAERDHYLSGACRNERELKEQVLSLLQAHEGAGDFLQSPQSPVAVVLTEKAGDWIGRYKLLKKKSVKEVAVSFTWPSRKNRSAAA